MKWISVKDKLPENTNPVLIAHFYAYYEIPDYAIAYYNGKWNVSEEMLDASNYDGGASIYLIESPTHWMPLPKPPKDKK